MFKKRFVIKAVLFVLMYSAGFFAHHFLDHPDNFFEQEAEKLIEHELERLTRD